MHFVKFVHTTLTADTQTYQFNTFHVVYTTISSMFLTILLLPLGSMYPSTLLLIFLIMTGGCPNLLSEASTGGKGGSTVWNTT